jgi:hypothetical protein
VDLLCICIGVLGIINCCVCVCVREPKFCALVKWYLDWYDRVAMEVGCLTIYALPRDRAMRSIAEGDAAIILQSDYFIRQLKLLTIE